MLWLPPKCNHNIVTMGTHNNCVGGDDSFVAIKRITSLFLYLSEHETENKNSLLLFQTREFYRFVLGGTKHNTIIQLILFMHLNDGRLPTIIVHMEYYAIFLSYFT